MCFQFSISLHWLTVIYERTWLFDIARKLVHLYMIYDDLRINKNMINMWFSIANYEITIPDHVFFGYMFKDRRLFGVFLNDSMMQWDSWGKNPMDWWLVGMGLTGNHGYFPIFSMGKNSGVNFPKQTNPLRKWRCLSWCHWWRSDLLKMIFFYVFPWEIHCLGNRLREYVEAPNLVVPVTSRIAGQTATISMENHHFQWVNPLFLMGTSFSHRDQQLLASHLAPVLPVLPWPHGTSVEDATDARCWVSKVGDSDDLWWWENRDWWLVGGDWNHGILWFSIQLGSSSSQLTNSDFSEG